MIWSRIAVCLLGLFPVLLSGCGDAGADGGTVELKLAYVMAPRGPAHEAAEHLAKLVEERSSGTLRITLYPGAQLGSDRELIEALRLGSVDLVLGGTAPIGWYIPQYGAIELPYIFRDYDHLDAVLRGGVGEEMRAAMQEAQGLRILDFWHRGPRYLTANKAVRTPDDLAGLKLRVPELPTYIQAWRALGANVTPVTYSEIFLALKQGVVQGQENPLEAVHTSSLFEVQRYIMETQHLLGVYILMMSDARWSRLSEEHRTLLSEAIAEAGAFERERMLAYEQTYREDLAKKGMQFIEVDDAAFRQRVLATVPQHFQSEWAPNLFQRIQQVEVADAAR